MTKAADKSIDDTGERMVPAYHKTHMVYGEHIVRYQAAISLVKGQTVLDIASGSGYGTALLAQSASKVFGVDVDKDAIKYAQKNYGAKNIEFVLGDGTKIPLDDNAVDVVVSFETIEHIEDYETFMVEVERVLKPDGLFILSTPNDTEFPETNHFHIHEFERVELETLVAKHFKNHTSYYQATWLYNALLPEAKITGEWEQSITTMQTAPTSLDKCIYFYMLCSNRKVTEVLEPIAAISEHWSERDKQTYESSVRKHMDDQAAIIHHLEDKVAAVTAELDQVKHAAKEDKDALHAVHNSKTWKAARKLAKLRHLQK